MHPMRSRPALYPRAAWYFAAAMAIAIAGFFPSFFQRLDQVDAAHRMHGFSALAWMGLLTLQAGLIRGGHRLWHRRLGRGSWLIVLPFVIGGVLMLRSMLSGTGEFSRAFGPMLAFLDVTTLTYFTAAYVLAIVYRRQVHLHGRLMASTAVLVLPPAIARLLPQLSPAVDSFMLSLHLSLLCAELVVVALIVHDLRRWRLHPPHPVLLAFLLLQHASMQWVAGTAAWLALCRWIAGG
jgi:hypothetical protein